MSKSVDKTVFDFFNLLLSEPENAVTTPVVQQQKILKQPEPPFIEETAFCESRDNLAALDKLALEKLLAPVSLQIEADTVPQIEVAETPQQCSTLVASVSEKVVQTEQAKLELSLAVETVQKESSIEVIGSIVDLLEDEFQVLFFRIAGLTMAVPLIFLGGIVRLDKVNKIFGRPDWYLGVQNHRDSQLNIVDSCAWVMPEQYQSELAETVNYQYVIQLKESNWGLACESLINTIKIDKSQVNWRQKPGKRPWLAGVVKEQMCGILNVQVLIEMLDAGLGCQDSI